MKYCPSAWDLFNDNLACPNKISNNIKLFCRIILPFMPNNNTRETCFLVMNLDWWLSSNRTILIKIIFDTEILLFPYAQGGTCGSENCDGRGLMYCVWPITVDRVAGSGWTPIWLTRADQLSSALPEPGCQSYPPHVTCGSSVQSVLWIWSLWPECS